MKQLKEEAPLKKRTREVKPEESVRESKGPDEKGEEDRTATHTDKATKLDVADVTVLLWNNMIQDGLIGMKLEDLAFQRALNSMRNKWLLPHWKRKVTRDFG